MRILFVAISESVHTARWISQLNVKNWDVHLFPSDMGMTPHDDLRNLTIHSFFRRRKNRSDSSTNRKGIYWPLRRGAGRIKLISERIAPSLATESARLARTIRSLKPDIIHVLEMQSSGYLFLEARKRLPGYPFPPCIYSSWGSDIFFFGQDTEHDKRIRAFLAACDYYIADCKRDLSLTIASGFTGKTLGVFPAAGGYDLGHMRQFCRSGSPSSRRIIALKGYEGIRGAKALVALQALQRCADLLGGFQLVVYLASDQTRIALEELSWIKGLRVTELPYSPHDEIIKLMGKTRMAIGVGISDGTPNAMLEAMVMGAFPIQSDTVSTAEWIQDGRNGLLVSPEDPESIALAIRRVLSDDDLVNRAAVINAEITEAGLDRRVIQPKILQLYEKVAADGPLRVSTQGAAISNDSSDEDFKLTNPMLNL
jgi:hypothetical protein